VASSPAAGDDLAGYRIGQPEDLVALTAFLCTDAANHLLGSVIFVRQPING